MTSNSYTSPTPIPPTLLPQFEAVCNEFAMAWEKNESPDIQGFVERLESGEAKRHIHGVLIALEVRLRIASGENPEPSEYLKRFPNFENEVQFAFQESNKASSQDNAADVTRSVMEVDISLGQSLYSQTPDAVDKGEKANVAAVDDKAPIEWDDIPKRLGRYEIKRPIGQGGFGIVCLAQDTTLGRDVALKFAKHGSFESREHLSAFIREARIVARLQHPSIVTVFDIKRFGDLLCIVQQYVAGQDLRKELKAGLPSFRRAAELCQSIAEGIGFAHQHGFFHRDIKPANILIDENGRPQIADFGLAIHESAQRRRRGERTGTPRYMPPELVLGETHRIDGRSDIWSLGVVMYEMLTGNRAFNGSTLEEVFDEIQHRNPIPPRQINPAIPAELERICLKCLSKRVVDRYSSATDLAEDLSHWLFSIGAIELPENETQSVTAPRKNHSHDDHSHSKNDSVTFGALDQVKIVPRGLKSFDAHDADFFVHLLPGPRDRDGLPDSIRFWKNRVERDAVDDNDGIGLIYGPSGCGKSSFVKAGLIPKLIDRIIPIYVEATRSGTESRLKAAIRRSIPDIPDDLPLPAIFDMLRDGSWMRRGRKLLIVIDQFEQWLHNHNPSELSELARAIRHADGLRIECILMVRDDFWLATSRFMRTVEVDLLEGRNATLIDLFDKQHARKVLCEFGQAYNALPAQLADLTKAQTRFIKEVIDGIAEQEKVICVRLATFAEMFKDKPWTATELAKVGGPQGVGIKFLEDTFGSKLASPEHRLYEPAARKLLGALLPESGTDIRGNMLSASQLMPLVGYENRNKDFDNLTRILDQELRLITLTDPLGTLQEESIYSSGEPAQIDVAHFQLTHDFLVTPLREWLNLKQQSTMRGRAQIRLAKRCAMWSQQPSTGYLPGVIESANIFSLTKPSQWSEQESRMMRQAGWTHGIRLAVATGVLVLAGWILGSLYSEQQARNLVARLMEAETGDVPQIIEAISDSPRAASLVKATSGNLNEESDPKKRLHLLLARYYCDGIEKEKVLDALLIADPLETQSIVQLLAQDKESLGEPFWKRVKDADEPAASRVRLASALALWFPDDPQWNEVNDSVLAAVLDQVPFEIDEWGQSLKPVGKSLYPSVAEFIAVDRADPKTLISLARMFSRGQSLDSHIESKGENKWAREGTFYDRWRDSSDDHAANGQRLTQSEKQAREDSRLNYVKYNRELANLIAAQLVLNPNRESLWENLRNKHLTLRSYLIERIVKTGIDPQRLLERIKTGGDSEIESGLLLALGNFVRKDPQLGKRISDSIVQIYRDDPSSQVHSAAEWLLKLIHPAKSNVEIQSMLGDSTSSEQWQRIGHDITMIRLNAPGKVTLVDNRDPEKLRMPITVDMNQDLYIASTEISIGQIRQFAADGGMTETRIQEIARTFSDDHPAIQIRWTEAARFCNWLSAKEGISKDEYCYREDGDFMQLVDDWNSKKGFRLPTEFEWETACQSECLTTWNCGSDEELLREYAWYEINTSATGYREVRRCGLLKPNRLGLFDMHGNAGEQTITQQNSETATKNLRHIRKSGLPFSQAKEITCAYAFSLGFSDSQESVGFRVVRLAD